MLATIAVGIAACDGVPTEPTRLASGTPSLDVGTPVSQVYESGSHVQTWDPIPQILPANENWPQTICTTTPLVGRDANWQNPHNAFVLDGHPWRNDYGFSGIPWINAWNGLGSGGSGGTSPYYNWTKYSTEVAGNGAFVIRLQADNCSWIYLDGVLVGVQADDRSKSEYGLTLNGTHTLEFIIFDGGGLAGGQFKLETTSSPPPPLNPDLDGDSHPNDSDAFPLDPTEWADTDGDGTGDNGDAFPGDPAEQTDTDGDGTGDNGDVFPGNPAEQTDTDGDGTGDNGDAFPSDPTEHTDTDGDGVGDNADAYPNDPTRSSPDGDDDGIGNEADNCPVVPNANQADQDDDSVGDACDPDIDGDGVANGVDAFPTNPAESADSDGDGIGDNADASDQSNSGPTLFVGTCNTGVANWHIGNGTYANDLIAAAQASAPNHGKFVSAVAELANGWKKAGQITGRQQGEIVSCAARSK